MLETLLQALTVIFSLLAGGFWVTSAQVALPTLTAAYVPLNEKRLYQQAHYNSVAAVFAALAAIAQALILVLALWEKIERLQRVVG